jgi:hypothetical protein
MPLIGIDYSFGAYWYSNHLRESTLFIYVRLLCAEDGWGDVPCSAPTHAGFFVVASCRAHRSAMAERCAHTFLMSQMVISNR